MLGRRLLDDLDDAGPPPPRRRRTQQLLDDLDDPGCPLRLLSSMSPNTTSAASSSRLENVGYARKHLPLAQEPADLQKENTLEMHLARCADAQRIGDWKSVLRECEVVIMIGSLILTLRAEAILHLHQLEEADGAISSALRLEILCPFCP